MRLEAPAQAGEPLPRRVGAAHPVVAHAHPQQTVLAPDRDLHHARARVLGRVRQGLGDGEVGRRLDGRVEPAAGVDLAPHRDPAGAGQRADRRLQAPVAEHGRMDAAGQVAQLHERALGLLVRAGHQVAGRLVARRGQAVAGEAEVHGEGAQARLGAVVQVALDAAQLGRLGVDRPRPPTPGARWGAATWAAWMPRTRPSGTRVQKGQK